MSSEGEIDLIPLERTLKELSALLSDNGSEEAWNKVEFTAREIANSLRVRNSPKDNHTILGETDLPRTLVSLLSQGLKGSQIPHDDKTAPIFELLRVGANLCMDHNDNRAALLEVGFPQSVMSLLEGYAETVTSPPNGAPLALSIPHLKVVRTSVGVLLNASISYEPVKYRLISLEAAHTIIKLSANIYPPTSWTSRKIEPLNDEFVEEWNLRSGISNWTWRTLSVLKDIQDDTGPQVMNSDILPWITAPLSKFTPPTIPLTSTLADANPDLFDTLIQTDFDFLEESCTIIESLTLDLEDIRLELARAVCYPILNEKESCLATILKFIEYSSFPVLWKNPVFDDTERKNREKSFNICKAALIKAIVEVFAEEKNEEILWKNDKSEFPGGFFVENFVRWIKLYVDSQDGKTTSIGNNRDDMAICAGLSLGNLIRKEPFATALLSPPYNLAPVLSSIHFLSPSTDIKLKHGILGLLKHIAQFSKLSPIIPTSFAEVKVIEKIASSGIWDEKSDAMADVVQLSAIGVAKHMCNASLDHTFSFVLPVGESHPTGLSQILALIKRSDSISIKSEGSRILVNVVKSLWLNERNSVEPPDERSKKKERCISLILTPEYASTLTALIARSNKYPILVNEGIVAISLLSSHKLGGPLILEALTTPWNTTMPTVPDTLSPLGNGSTSPTSPTSRDGLPVPKHALEMLLFVLRNVHTHVNFPVEVRVNTCTFFTQLQAHKNVPAASLVRIREAVLPVVQQVVEESQEAPGEGKLYQAATILLEAWTPRKQPSVAS